MQGVLPLLGFFTGTSADAQMVIAKMAIWRRMHGLGSWRHAPIWQVFWRLKTFSNYDLWQRKPADDLMMMMNYFRVELLLLFETPRLRIFDGFVEMCLEYWGFNETACLAMIESESLLAQVDGQVQGTNQRIQGPQYQKFWWVQLSNGRPHSDAEHSHRQSLIKWRFLAGKIIYKWVIFHGYVK